MCQAAEGLYLATNGGSAAATLPTVIGEDFERWMLKTLCGSLYSGRVWKPLMQSRGIASHRVAGDPLPRSQGRCVQGRLLAADGLRYSREG